MADRVHDGMTDQTHVNIARDGRVPKRGYLTAAPAHSGMHFRDRAGSLHVAETDHAPVQSGGLPGTDGQLKPLAGIGKRTTLPVATPGHRHRSADALASAGPGENLRNASRSIDHDLGRRILDQAYAAGSAHDRMARTQQVPLAPKYSTK